MTPEQKAAYVVAQAALLNAEIAQLQSEPRYGEETYYEVVQRYQATIGHNAVMELFAE